MDTAALKKFAQEAGRSLREQVTAKLDLVLGAGSAARREAPSAVKKLEGAVAGSSREPGDRAGRLHLVQPLLGAALHGRERLHAASAWSRPPRGRRGRRSSPRRWPGVIGPDVPAAIRRAGAGRCSTGARRRATRRARPTGCCSSPPATHWHGAHAVPVREDRRLHRAADAGRPAVALDASSRSCAR